MKANEITNSLAKNIATLPVSLSAPMVAYTFGVTKPTATKSLDSLAGMGLLKKNGLIYSK